MERSVICAGLLLTGLLALLACGSKGAPYVSSETNAAQTNSPVAGELHYKAPDGWVKEQTSSSMRVAQYKLPKAEGDPEDALLVVYYFGATQGGAVQANIDRWISQMQQPDGGAAKDKAKTETSTVNGLKVTSVDVAGTYTAEMAPVAAASITMQTIACRRRLLKRPGATTFSSSSDQPRPWVVGSSPSRTF